MKSKGFSLIEALITISIFSLLISIAIPNLIKYKDIYEFEEIVSQAEYLFKLSKIKAMETTTNIGICVENNQIKIMKKTDSEKNNRNSNACSGTPYTSTKAKNGLIITGNSFNIDPRGLIIDNLTFPSTICIKYKNISYKFLTYKTTTMGAIKEPC